MALTDASTAAPRPRQHALDGMPARRIAALIAARDLSSTEAVDHFLSRLGAVNGKLNAVVVDLADSARQAAAKVDEALSRGEKLGPLAGVPVTIKECFDLVGTASTFGLASRRGEIESKDDPHVAALRAAGAIPIAKTNLPQLMIFTETDNPLYGRTNNPWDPERSCGGSSGGEAAVIAAGGSPLGLGNDIGGSLRIPAAFCGIASIRPTAGARPIIAPTACRSVSRDRRPGRPDGKARRRPDMGLRVLDRARDPYAVPGPELGDPDAVDLGRLRFATFTDDGEFPVAPAVRRAVTEAARILTAAGAKPVAWQAPDLTRATDFLFASLSADRAQAFRRLLRGNRVDRRVRPLLLTAGMPLWLRGVRRLRSRRTRPAAYRPKPAALRHRQRRRILARRSRRLAEFRNDLLRSLETADGGPIDLILCPAYAVPAVRHGATELMPMPGAYAPLANVSGFPAGIVPVTRVRAGEESDRPASRDLMDRVARESERGSAGLPIAVQVIARPWRDHVALAAMAKIEAEARKQPDYPARPPL